MYLNSSEFEKKTILITGASSGIGRQTAIDLSVLGADIILVGRRANELEKTLGLMREGNHRLLVCDLTKFENLEGLVGEAVESHGRLSGFVHSAGIESTMPVNSITPDYYNKIFSVNVTSAFEIIRVISKKKYLAPDGASLVLIASVMGILGQPGKTAYCSSKGALISGARALALELASKKIRVNCVSPAVVRTEMTKELFRNLPQSSEEAILKMHPLGMGTPEDISNACIFLLSSASRWITGTNLIVDGGYSSQ